MKRFVFRISVAAAACAVGLAVASIYRLDKAQTIAPIAMPIAELRPGTDCFPGKSQEFTASSNSSYFPRRLLSQDEWRDQFKTDWYAKHLGAMDEAPLSFPDEQVRESYRFLWLRSFHHPVGVRLWKTEMDQFITVNELSGAGGYEPGTSILKSQRRLSQSEWDAFKRLLEYSCYWEQPTDADDAGLDGAQWLLEGFREGRYHLVVRWTPQKGSFREACLYMLKLSRLKIDTKTEPLY
ncbi:MAG TPA: hypothetical protein VN844_27185 [Pyrinomonadaceae bacterium]|nr:hypothetical protein [Pyrinomonadaceae bacterium]